MVFLPCHVPPKLDLRFVLPRPLTRTAKCLRVNLFLVTEANWFQREQRFAGFVHRLDLVLKTRRGRRHAKLTASAYHYSRACHCGSIDSSDKCTCLIPTADADRSRLASDPGVGNIDVAIAYGEIFAGPGSDSRIVRPSGIIEECAVAHGDV